MTRFPTSLRDFIVAIKQHNWKQLEEDRVYFLLQGSDHTASLSEASGRTEGGNLDADIETEAMEESAYWLSFHGFLSLDSYTIQDHLAIIVTSQSSH